MKLRKLARHISVMILSVFVAVVLLPAASFASVSGRKNTTIALAALSLYSLSKGRTTQGLLLGGGTYYAYKRYAKERDKQKRHSLRYRYRR
ncbi:MAG: hypothetical protein Q7T82_08040 [Armatimonadota bacterium]|nr:hypothetical protein [Armatimonadota bacterium]